jgi:serine/threonine-protein kinase RsbW
MSEPPPRIWHAIRPADWHHLGRKKGKDAMPCKVLEIPAVIASLGTIAHFVQDVAAEAGLDPTAAYRLRLAVDEIATNVITYGYTGIGAADAITVECRITDTEVIVELIDRGQAFDPLTSLPDPDELTKPLDERRIGGLGIFLARSSVDDFRYERVKDTNHNTFVVNRVGRADKGGDR